MGIHVGHGRGRDGRGETHGCFAETEGMGIAHTLKSISHRIWRSHHMHTYHNPTKIEAAFRQNRRNSSD